MPKPGVVVRKPDRVSAKNAEYATAYVAQTGAGEEGKEPLWTGPGGEGLMGGVTQSLLGGWLSCRESARIKLIEGLSPPDSFRAPIEYGSMWHLCEEELKAGRWENPAWASPTAISAFFQPLTEYTEKLCSKYPFSQDQILHWYNVCKIQFPIYERFWRERELSSSPSESPSRPSSGSLSGKEDGARTRPKRTTLFVEEKFDVPYRLPSGRVVRLRGKFDSVDLVGEGKGSGLLLQENKTKGEVDEEAIKRQLLWDLQTMWYLTALKEIQESKESFSADWRSKVRLAPISGILYNVVRRPLSGGKGSIRQKQGESLGDFYSRLRDVIEEGKEEFFLRLNVEIAHSDIERFEIQFMKPVLEQLCDWYEWVKSNHSSGSGPWGIQRVHWRTPYFYNPLADGGEGETDEYLAGNRSSLVACRNLFPELQEIE